MRQECFVAEECAYYLSRLSKCIYKETLTQEYDELRDGINKNKSISEELACRLRIRLRNMYREILPDLKEMQGGRRR